jgi:hypothetical protein
VTPAASRSWLPALLLALFGLLVSAPVAAALGPPAGLDERAWELVSPLEKNGGAVGAPGTLAAGVEQAASVGGAAAFGSGSSFGEAAGALPVNQYLAHREADAWRTVNVTPPALSGTYTEGAYQLFAADLSAAVLSDGSACRDGAQACAAQGAPLAPGGPSGYRNLYLQHGSSYSPLITVANAPALTLPAEDFHAFAAGATPDLSHIVLSTCAALTEDASEVPGPAGCDPAAQNLYLSDGQNLDLINFLPGAGSGTPGAALAPGDRAVSVDGSRVYWTHAGDLYLDHQGTSILVADEAAFQAASEDGSLAFYLKAGQLYRYDATTGLSASVTSGGPVLALVGSSRDGSVLYYVTATGLYRLRNEVLKLLIGANSSQLPPATGRSRASGDGDRFFFDTAIGLRSTDTNGADDVYEWEAQGAGSCSQAGGCLALISSGRLQPASFLDASDSGDDVFFTTAASLLPSDPASLDVYDARSAGGFPEATGADCFGDDCQGPVSAPIYELPATGSLIGIPNPPATFAKRCRKAPAKRRRCGRKRHNHHRPRQSHGGRR